MLTVANYQIGLLISNREINAFPRKLAFAVGLAINLGSLIFFKYTNFIISSCWRGLSYVATILGWPGPEQAVPQLQILLPLGISFFVFEFIHYLSDVYQGRKAIEDPVRFGLFAAFFPSQIAGPIKRFEDFDAQVVDAPSFNRPLAKTGAWLILEGLFKKVVLGDNLAAIVQLGFGHANHLSGIDAWVCTLAFALQIYYDFSGYTDIGRGSAMLLGFRLPENFNKPYFASELIDFWHRWHISLSTWLRDYLYKPLGGSRNDTLSKYRNLLITMLIGGLWHGASWHYILWGAYHGVGLIVNHGWRSVSSHFPQNSNFGKSWLGLTTGFAVTFLFVLLGWVLFRASSAQEAFTFYTRMFDLHTLTMSHNPCARALLDSVIPASFSVYGSVQIIKFQLKNGQPWTDERQPEGQRLSLRWWLTPPPIAQAFAYIGCGIIVLALCARKSNPFIYFQF